MRFLALIITAVILFCGVGSIIIVGVSALTLAPASRKTDEARQAASRLFSVLAKDWSEESLRRVHLAPDSPEALRSLKAGREQLGTLLGAPRIRITKGPEARDAKECADILVRAVFEKKEALVPLTICRGSDIGPWGISVLDEPRDLEDEEAAPEGQKGASGAEAGSGKE